MDKKIMSFDEFTQEIVANIKDHLPVSFSNAEIQLSEVTKNNDVTLTGITIRDLDSNISPTIYLNQYYKKYMDGADMEYILSEIADVRVKHEVKESIDISCITDFNLVRDKIVPRLSSLEWNAELLKDKPHTDIADLAVTYHIIFSKNEAGVMSVPITHKLMETWCIDLHTLHELAVKNMTVISPSKFQSLSSMLAGLLPGFNVHDENVDPETDDMLYVITSDSKVNGAANILDPVLMSAVLDRFNDFYLIPSSIHEWLLVPANGVNPSILTSMVCDVNASEVSPGERLSSHVYRYTREDGLIAA